MKSEPAGRRLEKQGLPVAPMRVTLKSMNHLSAPGEPDQRINAGPRAEPAISFSREELGRILSLYGYFVAAGEWRDYAVDHLKDGAVFSVYRHAAETPIYRIEKRPALANRQGAFAVIAMTGAVLKRGHDLAQVLRVFDRKKLRLAK